MMATLALKMTPAATVCVCLVSLYAIAESIPTVTTTIYVPTIVVSRGHAVT